MKRNKEAFSVQASGPISGEPGVEVSRRKWRDIVIAFFISLPVLSLSLSAVMWLRFGVDIPFWDDWRNYETCRAGIFSLKIFFTPSNDTLYPVGLFLDYLSQRFLNGNTIAYQFISMTVVQGSLLILQWRLLLFALKDRLLAASAFSLTILMLQPDSYWGLQNIAYHQALPLICILSSIYIIVASPWRKWWSISALFVLGIISGLAYTSGAFSILTVGIICFTAGYFVEPEERGKYKWGGLTLIIAGILTSIPQAWVILVIQKGLHRRKAIPAYPNEIAFWAFAFGKIGRSLMLPVTHPVFSLVSSILAAALALALLVRGALRTVKGLPRQRETGITVIYISLFAAIFVYLLMVAFGRAHLQSHGAQNPMQVFLIGFSRFHFYWITLLWPWVMAACLHAAQRTGSPNPGKFSLALATGLPLVVLPLLIISGALGHAEPFRANMQNRLDGIRCCLSKIQNGEAIECPQLHYRDMTEALRYAASIDASFIRSLPILPPPAGANGPPPLFRFSEAAEKDVELLNTTALDRTPEGYKFQSAGNSRILFRTDAPEVMKSCANLGVTGMLRVSEPDMARLYFKVQGQKAFSDTEQKVERLLPNKWQKVTFSIFSSEGFADGLRFEPVAKPQVFELRDLEVRCSGFPLRQ